MLIKIVCIEIIGKHKGEGDSDSGESDMDPTEHKKSLKNLAEMDPEFYAFLEKNDKQLLDFNLSDDDDKSSVNGEDLRHTLDDNLEVNYFFIVAWTNRSDDCDYLLTFLTHGNYSSRVNVFWLPLQSKFDILCSGGEWR